MNKLHKKEEKEPKRDDKVRFLGKLYSADEFDTLILRKLNKPAKWTVLLQRTGGLYTLRW